jgi:hypothetical protein
MDKQTKVIIGLGIAAVAGYYIWSKYYSSSSVVVVPTAAAAPTGLTVLPSGSAAAAAPVSSTVTQGSAAAPMSNSNGAVLPSDIYGWIFQHAQPWPSEFFDSVFPSFTAADVANLTNIVRNYFNTNTPVPQGPLNTWWDTTFSGM